MPTPGDDDSGWSSTECRLRDLLIEGTALGVEQGAIPYEYLEYPEPEPPAPASPDGSAGR